MIAITLSQTNREVEVKFLGMLTVLAIAGCTNTPADLVGAPESYEGAFQSETSPQTVYRNIREAGRLCMEHSPGGTPVVIETDFDPEARAGEITQRMIAQGVRLNLSIIKINAAGSSGSGVKVYTLKGLSASGTKRPSLDQVKRWAAGDKNC